MRPNIRMTLIDRCKKNSFLNFVIFVLQMYFLDSSKSLRCSERKQEEKNGEKKSIRGNNNSLGDFVCCMFRGQVRKVGAVQGVGQESRLPRRGYAYSRLAFILLHCGRQAILFLVCSERVFRIYHPTGEEMFVYVFYYVRCLKYDYRPQG